MDKKLYKKQRLNGGIHTLKELNDKIAMLKMLVQDYSIETMPQWVAFSTTTVCNLQCPFCESHGTRETRKEYNNRNNDIPYKTLLRLSNESLLWANEFSLALNGEPLLTSCLEEFLEDIAPYGAKLDLTTNGTLLSKKMLIKLFPVLKRVGISMDAATELTYEKIRVGGKLKTVLNNIRLLTKTVELLKKSNHPDILISSVILGTNIQELPLIVKLAHVLKVPTVDFNFVVLSERNQHIRNEDVKLHKQLYNTYFPIVQEIAKQHNINLGLPLPFPGIKAYDNVPLGEEGMIIKYLPEGYYEKLPTIESFLDQNTIEKEAVEIADIIKKNTPEDSVKFQNRLMWEKQAKMQDSFKQLFERYKNMFNEIKNKKNQRYKYCEFIQKRIYISPGDIVPCCTVGRPILGNIHQNTIKEIWNGKLYKEFRQRFYSSNPFDCCNDCSFVQYLPYPDPKEFTSFQI